MAANLGFVELNKNTKQVDASKHFKLLMYFCFVPGFSVCSFGQKTFFHLENVNFYRHCVLLCHYKCPYNK